MSVEHACKRCGAKDADIGAGYCSACLFSFDLNGSTIQGFMLDEHPELVTPEQIDGRLATDKMLVIQIDRLRLSDGTIVERLAGQMPFMRALENIATSYDGADPMLGENVPAGYVSESIPDDEMEWVSTTLIRTDNGTHDLTPAVAGFDESFRVIWTERTQTQPAKRTITSITHHVADGYPDLRDALIDVYEAFAAYDSDRYPKLEVAVTIVVPSGNTVPQPGELTKAEYERSFGMPWPDEACPNCDGAGYIEDVCPGGPSGDAMYPPEQAMCLVCSGTGLAA